MTTKPSRDGQVISDGQVIRDDESYTIAEFRRRTSLGDFAWRQARKVVQVRTLGKRHYVLGRDWNRYLAGVTQLNKDNVHAVAEG